MGAGVADADWEGNESGEVGVWGGGKPSLWRLRMGGSRTTEDMVVSGKQARPEIDRYLVLTLSAHRRIRPFPLARPLPGSPPSLLATCSRSSRPFPQQFPNKHPFLAVVHSDNGPHPPLPRPLPDPRT